MSCSKRGGQRQTTFLCSAATGLVVRRTAVTEVRRDGKGWRVVHGYGEDRVDACVLAMGHAPPLSPNAVESPDAAGYVADPWAAGALAAKWLFLLYLYKKRLFLRV